MSCQLKAKFKYVDKLPDKKTSRMFLGIACHEALDWLNHQDTLDVDGAIDVFTASWDDAFPQIEIWFRGDTFEGLRSAGIAMLREHCEKLEWNNRIVIGSEHRFLVPFGKHEITGAVDLIEVRKSGRGKDVLRLVDYKTASKKPYKNVLFLNTQMTLYHYASMHPQFWFGNEEDYGQFPPLYTKDQTTEELWERYQPPHARRTIWFHLRDGKEIDCGPREQSDFMRTYRAVSEISRAMEHEVFVPNISAESCTFCPYTEPCGVTIPTDADYYQGDEFF